MHWLPFVVWPLQITVKESGSNNVAVLSLNMAVNTVEDNTAQVEAWVVNFILNVILHYHCQSMIGGLTVKYFSFLSPPPPFLSLTHLGLWAERWDGLWGSWVWLAMPSFFREKPNTKHSSVSLQWSLAVQQLCQMKRSNSMPHLFTFLRIYF